MTPRDCTDVEVVNITVEQPRAEPEKKARRTSWKLRRQLSVFGHERRAWKERHPCMVELVGVLLGGLSLGLYFFDVVTDVLLTKTFFQYGHPGWGWMTVTFVAVPYLVAAVGVFNYYLGANSVRWENDEGAQNRRKRVVFLLFPLWMPACAAMPLVFDVLMPFNFIVGAHLSDSLSNFLVQYEATRVLAETILESIPQMLLQIFIFVYCGNDDARHRGWEPDHVPGLNHTAPSPTTSPPGQCGGVTREGQDALTMSLIASVLSIVYRFAMTWLEMKRMKMTFKEYVVSLMEMGAGLPLRAIVENAATNVKIHEDLIDSELRSLAAVLEKNTSVETVNHEWPLIWAVQEGYAVLVSVFLAKERMDANQVDQDGRTALSWAAKKGHADIVTLLLGHAMIDVNQADESGRPALYWAAQKGHVDTVTLLLGHAKIDVNQADKDGMTALSWAFQKGHVDTVMLLLGHAKIDVNQADKYGTTALSWAIQKGHADIVTLLLGHAKIDVNAQGHFNFTALHWAVVKNRPAFLIQLLSDDKIDCTLKDNRKYTPLKVAIDSGRDECVKILMEHGGSEK